MNQRQRQRLKDQQSQKNQSLNYLNIVDQQCKKIDPSSYIQVNYFQDSMYKFNQSKDAKIPLNKEQQILIDYLQQLKDDQECLVTPNLFNIKDHNKYEMKKSSSFFQFFDPVKHLENIEKKKKKHMNLANQILQTRKFSQNPEKGFLRPLDNSTQQSQPFSYTQMQTQAGYSKKKKLLRKNTNQKINKGQMQSKNISRLINELLQKSQQLKSPKRLRKSNFRTRVQIDRENQKKIKEEKNDILKLISNTQEYRRDKKAKQLADIPNTQKYDLNFINYQRTKTKSQIDKYIYEKKVKKPDMMELQRFQDFILSEAKFNVQHRYNLQKKFIKMRDQCRNVKMKNCLYSGRQKSDPLAWRSKSMAVTTSTKK